MDLPRSLFLFISTRVRPSSRYSIRVRTRNFHAGSPTPNGWLHAVLVYHGPNESKLYFLEKFKPNISIKSERSGLTFTMDRHNRDC